MSINFSTSMGYGSNAYYQNSNKKHSENNSEESKSKELQNVKEETLKTITTTEYELPSYQQILMSSTQISINSSLKKTLKYLNSHKEKIRPKHVFGELWDSMNSENKLEEEFELINIEIDLQTENIFAA